MAEIIEILGLPTAKSQYFTVNKAVDFVDLLIPAAPSFKLQNNTGATNFRKGDSFILLTAGIVLPESFTAHKQPATMDASAFPAVRLQIQGITSGQTYYCDTFGFANEIYCPLENHEIALDVFNDTQKQVQHAFPLVKLEEPFYLTGQISSLKISMAGCPASLDTKSIIVTPFYKILHNIPMY